jgi:hypothetical protein
MTPSITGASAHVDISPRVGSLADHARHGIGAADLAGRQGVAATPNIAYTWPPLAAAVVVIKACACGVSTR